MCCLILYSVYCKDGLIGSIGVLAANKVDIIIIIIIIIIKSNDEKQH